MGYQQKMDWVQFSFRGFPLYNLSSLQLSCSVQWGMEQTNFSSFRWISYLVDNFWSHSDRNKRFRTLFQRYLEHMWHIQNRSNVDIHIH